MPIPKSAGFAGLSKATTKPAAPAAPAQSFKDAAVAEVKAKAAVAPTPVKTRAQILREEAAAAEAEEAAAAASAAEPEVLEAEVEPEVEAAPAPASKAAAKPSTAVAILKSSGFGLATIDRKAMANALLAFTEVAETKKVPSLFPTLICSGGEQGGLWVNPSWQSDDVGNLLPQGKKPVIGFYLGYRMDVTIWPKEYDQKNPGKDKPCAGGVVSCDNVELSKIATKAVKNFQFTKKALKEKFDTDANGAGSGRPSISVEIIVYLPPNSSAGWDGGLVVLRTAPGYGPSARTMGNLARMIDPETQEIPNLPMSVKINTEHDSSETQKWPTHFFEFATDGTSAGKAVFDAFESYKATAMEDAEFMAKFADWMSGADKPLTDDTVSRLKLAASL